MTYTLIFKDDKPYLREMPSDKPRGDNAVWDKEEFRAYCASLPCYPLLNMPESWKGLKEIKGEWVRKERQVKSMETSEWVAATMGEYLSRYETGRRIVFTPIDQPDSEGEGGCFALYDLLAKYGGTIESTGKMDEMNIKQARASGRMWVDDNSIGYVWMPEGVFPESPEQIELFEKWFPLPVELPESLKTLDWMKDKATPASPSPDSAGVREGGLEGIAENLFKLVYQYIQWETSNTNKKPDFQKCHDAMDAYNSYLQAIPPGVLEKAKEYALKIVPETNIRRIITTNDAIRGGVYNAFLAGYASSGQSVEFAAVSPHGKKLTEGYYKDADGNDFQLINLTNKK